MAFNGHVPDVELYWRQVVALLLLYAAFDWLVARHTKARYFAIHVLANGIVALCTLPGCVRVMASPAAALMSSEFSATATAANLCIHMYHIVAFRDLTWLDWLHHITMTFIVMPITFTHDSFFGYTCDMQNFLACGLPGGLDYAMLFAVKHGWMTPLDEKRHNATINTWLRAPGIVFTCGLAFVQFFMKDPTLSLLDPGFLPPFVGLSLFVWNAQYFSARVVGNYHVRQYQEDQRKKTQAQS